MIHYDQNTSAAENSGFNPSEFSVQPARLYQPFTGDIEDLKVDDIVPVRVIEHDPYTQMSYCVLNHKNTSCFIRDENFLYPEKVEVFGNSITPSEIKSSIKKQVIAKITNISPYGTIELERKPVKRKTIQYLSKKIQSIIPATIEKIYPYGVFVDIGNGLSSLVHITQLTVSHYDHISDYYKVGDKINVKILDFNPENLHFTVSCKQAYEKVILPPGSIQKVRICNPVNSEGYFVEFNPATCGIMDNPTHYPLRTGEYAFCRIKKIREKGFHAKFIFL